MIKNARGFTIVEIVVTVVVISILASLAVFGYSQVQKDARNSARASKIQVIADALEKYYAKNGEYPGCPAMTQSGNQVAANVLPGIDADALVAPGSPAGTTNSIVCTALSAGSNTNNFAYVGDGSATCSTGNACLYYTLQYRNEGSGAIVAVDSKYKTKVAATTGVTVTATAVGDTQINISWTAANNATGYQLQRADDNNFSTNLVSSSPSGLTTSATGLTPGKAYFFRVAPVGATGQGVWSNVASATTTIAAPPAPTASSSLNGSTITITSSAVICASGTVEYQLLHRSSNTNTFPAFTVGSSWSGTTSINLTASQGYKYEFQSQARCKGPNAASNDVASATGSLIITIATPAAPTYLSPPSFKSNVYAVVNYQGYCPTGTTAISKTFRSRAWTGGTWTNPWGFNDSWTNTTGSNKNVEYWGKYQCQTIHHTSPMSPESYNVIVVTP
ncbi:MAG TPA: fibronectin type III domain-containing protein [Candidatus Saccharimonadales bacterium]|nr:fibronectin type III domain-containing protein [Candidatus Saccharimonadales bacterium]